MSALTKTSSTTAALRAILSGFLVAFALAACGGGDTSTAPKTITVSLQPGTLSLVTGQNAQLSVAVTNASQLVSYTTTDAGVAAVSSSGMVTAVAAGTAVITAASNEDPNARASMTVTVRAPVTLTVGPSIITVGTGQTGQLTAVVTGTSNTTIAWSTSAPAVATVSASGLITGVGVGTATITATSDADPTKTASVLVTVNSPADLVVDAVSAPVAASSGGSIPVTATIRNQGGSATTAFQVGIYYSTDANITNDDVYSGGGCLISTGLAAGGTTDCVGTITVPSTLPAGTYFVGAIADNAAQIVESNELNNTRAAPAATTIAVTGPDLVVSAMTAPATAFLGDSVFLSATARNQSAATTTSFRMSLYFSTDATITAADFSTGYGCTYAGLGAGLSGTCSGNIPVPPSLAAGTYFIGAIVDANGTVTEIDETNNARAAANSTVLSIKPVAVTVSPQVSTIAVAQTQQLTAVVTGTTNIAVTWSSSADAVATVSTAGLVTAVGTGTAEITVQSVADPAKTAKATITVTPGGGPFNMVLTKAYVSQTVQSAGGEVQLVAGKPGIARAFVTGTVANSARPIVRVRIFNGATLQSTIDIQSAPLSVPFSTTEGPLAGTWNTTIPGNLVQPGLRIVFDVDPANTITESSDDDNSYTITPTVVVLPTLRARFVPIRQSANQLVGDVTTANMSDYMSVASTIHPIAAYTTDVHSVYTTTTVLGSDYSIGWSAVLNEIDVLRLTEGDPTAFYYGVMKPDYSFGGTGLGYVGRTTAMGVDWSNLRAQTLAHEWGHNFGRSHSPCGDPASPDPSYPYAGGLTGAWGYDAATASEKPPTFTDIMGYCDRATQWISDYTYNGVLARRIVLAGAAGNAPAENTLVVWGRITPNGMILEPAFEAFTQPSMPEGFGDSRIQGFDAEGGQLFSYAINGTPISEVDTNERLFAYAIPLRLIGAERLQSLRLSRGALVSVRASARAASGVSANAAAPSFAPSAVRSGSRVSVAWDARAFPMVVVRDPRTNEILSLARGGAASIPTSAPNLSLQFTDGVHSTTSIMGVR